MPTQLPIPEDHCTHVVKTYRDKICVDSMPFVYDGNDVVAYALDLLKRYGKIGNIIEITST